MKARLWDLFCRVVDNFGDVGVCWRLAADLAERGEQVRLWIDDASALAWMAPKGAAGVALVPWRAEPPDIEPGDVVVEAFGCDPPPGFVRRMASKSRPPCWINLEYLSAEDYVERSHRLHSPQSSGPGAGLTKWFFYPGFTAESGGLIREREVLARRDAFDANAWLAGMNIERRTGEQLISLFCYEQPALEAMLGAIGMRPTLLLAVDGEATRQMKAVLGDSLQRGASRCVALPLLSQVEFDRLLWSCDVNLVRGEDSFVRAQWAGAPFVWQIYPQHDDAHAIKLQAFLDRFLADAAPALAADITSLWRHWNGLAPGAPCWPQRDGWQALATRWREGLATQADLTSQLLGFVDESG